MHRKTALYVGNAFKNIIIFIVSGTILVLSNALQIVGVALFVLWDSGMDRLERKRVILDREGKDPYLIRYYLLFKNRSGSIPFNVFIHKFVKGDDDHLHDHPWGYFTFILSGGYNETVRRDSGQEYTHWRGPGFYQTVPPKHTHKIALDPKASTCWTLFVPFRRSREWGFIEKKNEEEKWVPADEYLSKLKGGSSSDDSNAATETAMRTRSQSVKKSI